MHLLQVHYIEVLPLFKVALNQLFLKEFLSRGAIKAPDAAKFMKSDLWWIESVLAVQ